jgi:hypothetical protein
MQTTRYKNVHDSACCVAYRSALNISPQKAVLLHVSKCLTAICELECGSKSVLGEHVIYNVPGQIPVIQKGLHLNLPMPSCTKRSIS